ncbi:MAG: S9 family peptidase, partial [bacterium]
MPQLQIVPYGSWKSPITSDMIVSKSVKLGQIALDGDDIYWIEMRPEEAGRNVIVRHTPEGKTTDILPAPFNARTRVHEYGGGAFTVQDGTVYFSNFTDQCLYKQTAHTPPEPLTPAQAFRYTDGIIDVQRNRMICIREDHSHGAREAVNTLVSLHLNGTDSGQVLVSGNDFYASPRLHPDGSKLAWLTWNHPNMPWDGTELWVGEFKNDGTLGCQQKVAGGMEESIFQPEWSP